jgi:hypothetical protein
MRGLLSEVSDMSGTEILGLPSTSTGTDDPNVVLHSAHRCKRPRAFMVGGAGVYGPICHL